MTNKRMLEAAANSGLTLRVASSHICLGKVVLKPPVVNSAIVSSSKDTMNAKRNAEISPGRINGRVILSRVLAWLAPNVLAAWSNRWS